MKVLSELLSGKWFGNFRDYIATGERCTSDAEQAGAKREYSEAARPSEASASASPPVETDSNAREAKALEQFMLGRSFIKLGRRAEVENRNPSVAYFKAVDHFDAMARIDSAAVNPAAVPSSRVADAEVLRGYAAGLGHFALGRQLDEKDFSSRGHHFFQAWKAFDKVLGIGSDPASAAGLSPILKSEVLTKRLSAIGQLHLADGAIFASQHMNSKLIGSFQAQAAVCKKVDRPGFHRHSRAA